jgi:ketosteroid isomerase-like protein
MVSDLDQFKQLYHKSVEAFIEGDPDAQKALWSPRDDVTLANPLGPPAKGADRVFQALDSAAALISDGEGYTFDSISSVETADLAYEIGIEHNTARLGNAAEKVQLSLRVTTVYRREDGEWKIVHRHADPITEQRPVESVVQPSGDAS